MENKMEDYYKVMQYLREMFVDRQYPYDFEDEELLGSDSSISLVDSEYGDFEQFASNDSGEPPWQKPDIPWDDVQDEAAQNFNVR